MKQNLFAMSLVIVFAVMSSTTNVAAGNGAQGIMNLFGTQWIDLSPIQRETWSAGFCVGSWISMQILLNNKWITQENGKKRLDIPAPSSVTSSELVDNIDNFYKNSGRLDYSAVYIAFISRWEPMQKGAFDNMPLA